MFPPEFNKYFVDYFGNGGMKLLILSNFFLTKNYYYFINENKSK